MAVRTLSSVTKTLAVLDYVASSPRPVRLTEVAKGLEEARAATHQRLITLVDGGWIEQTEEGSYRLTLRIVRYASMAMEQGNLGERVADVLQDMVTESLETASLAILEGHEAVILRRVESKGILRADLRVGARLNLERTAMGRILVAHARPEVIAQLRAEGVALPDEALLETYRQQGYAVSGMTGPRAVSAVAVPIFDNHDHCIAALAISGPEAGFDLDKCAAIASAAADVVNARLRGAQA
ncbi:IclR family transcriptional regulator [Pseudomonas sp. 10-1B]|uniref:IclR family transcriptional regulator n=1 Tax=Pseudomonas sp. 10-1B TaxID=1546029 RepID=UPI00061EC914|nr:IclR family transcriptional regulator [Pseudomonas sp. 10-1B]KIY38431.1 IclR family transcriptional regulator [Pseudomonas sp. 10-1B]